MMQWLDTLWSMMPLFQSQDFGVWAYILLAVLVAVEGPIATLIGAAAASGGLMSPGWVFVAASIGNLSADALWYGLGYLGRVEWLLRYGRWLGVREHHLNRLRDGMHEHVFKVLLFAKLTAGLIIPSLIAAGLVRIPWRNWLPPILIAETIWTGTLVLIGFFATEAIKQVEQGVQYVAIAASVLFVLGVLWWLRRAFRQTEQIDDLTTKD